MEPNPPHHSSFSSHEHKAQASPWSHCAFLFYGCLSPLLAGVPLSSQFRPELPGELAGYRKQSGACFSLCPGKEVAKDTSD